ncbi:MAG: hypothetical protein QM697_01030 [Lachnospiraceae bacterium]
MKELYQRFLTAYENYRGTGKLLVLFLVSILVIYLTEKKDEKGRRRFHPAVFLLSIWSGIAYAGSKIADFLFSSAENIDRKKRISPAGILALLLCIFTLCLSGTKVLSRNYFQKAENTMHIRTEYIQVMDAILADDEYPKVVAPPGFAPYLKMYSARFETLYDYPKNGDVSQLSADARAVYEQLSGSVPNMKTVAEAAKENGCRYVILSSEKYYPEFPITSFGFQLADTVGEWEIYKETEGNGI